MPDPFPTSPTSFRIGHGYDIHRLQSGGQLVLGGIVVANDVSPIAYSDGDVAIHSLMDAILGAMAWGDIGDLFPNTNPRWKNAASIIFLNEVLGRLNATGARIINADLTILAERPKLGPIKKHIAEYLSQLLNCPVNVKAGTHEGCDAIGRAEAIACHAVVLLALKN